MDFNLSYFAQEIKTKISTKELLSAYGIHINSRGFAKCPFHKEKTASMKIYEGDRGYYCFGCRKSGDIITFVRDYFGLSFKDAILKINEDFSLGFNLKSFSRIEKTQMAKKVYLRLKKIEKEKEKIRLLEANYWDQYDTWLIYRNYLDDYRPKNEKEPLHPLFVMAAQNISYQEYLLECAYMEKIDYETEIKNNKNS